VANVSIPSTVTLEFAAMNRPVVNVCFDLPEAVPLESSNRRFWMADFYRDVREKGLAVPAFSPSEMITQLKRILEKPQGASRECCPQHRKPTEQITEIVGGLLSRA